MFYFGRKTKMNKPDKHDAMMTTVFRLPPREIKFPLNPESVLICVFPLGCLRMFPVLCFLVRGLLMGRLNTWPAIQWPNLQLRQTSRGCPLRTIHRYANSLIWLTGPSNLRMFYVM